VQIINGKVTQDVAYSYTYYLQANKAGKYTIAPAQIQVNGKVYTSNSLSIEVVGANSAGSNNNQPKDNNIADVSGNSLFVRVEVNKTSVFVGEQIIARVRIFTQESLAGFESSKLPNFSGFMTQEISSPTQINLQRENVNGQVYDVGILKELILFPQKSGEIIIEPADIVCVIRKKVRQPSFFDSGMRDFSKEIKSPPVKIQVKLPPANKPDNFSGAVGSFEMQASLDKTDVKTNEPVTLKIKISGNGNVKLVEAPKVDIPSDFEAYKPEAKTNISNTLAGQSGNKTFEYLFIPRHAGEFKIPPISFCFLDVKTGQYKTIQSPEFPITVQKGQETEGQVQLLRPDKENLKTLDVDIRFIKTDVFKLHEQGHIFSGSLSFYLLYVFPLLILIILFIVRRKQIKENANLAQVKHRKASKISKSRLKKASAHMKNNEREHFYNEVLRATWGYLSDKLGIPLSELTKDNVVETLLKKNISSDLLTFLRLAN
jgi:hypothetical protein